VTLSAECHKNHRRVSCNRSFHFKPKPRLGYAPKRKLKMCSLQTAKVRVDFQESIQYKLETSNYPANLPPDLLWDHIKTAVLKETLGFSTKKKTVLLDENNHEIQKMLAEETISTPSSLGSSFLPTEEGGLPSCNTLQCKGRNIQNERWTNLAERTQYCADPCGYRDSTKLRKPYMTPSRPSPNLSGKRQ